MDGERRDPTESIDAEVAAMLRDWEAKLGTAGQLNTLRRLCGQATSAQGEREAAKAMRKHLARANDDLRTLRGDLRMAYDKIAALKQQVAGQQRRIAELAAGAGETHAAGETAVTPPAGAMTRLSGAWRTAVAAFTGPHDAEGD